MLEVVSRRHWWMIGVCCVLTVAGLVYLTFGRVAVTAEGRAIILAPDKIKPIYAPAAGQLKAWNVSVGDRVEKGDVLARIEQPAIQKKLELDRKNLAALKEQNLELSGLTETFGDLELRRVEQKGKLLEDRIASLTQQIESNRKLSDANYQRKIAYYAQQERDLVAVRSLNERRSQELQTKLKRYNELREKRLRSADAVLEVRRDASAQRLRLADIDLQLLEIGVSRIKTVEAHQDGLDGVATLQDSAASLQQQLGELDSRKVQLAQQDRSSDYRLRSGESELRRRIARHEEELARTGNLVSEHAGRVVDLSTGDGQLLRRGQHLGTIDTRNEEDALEALVYFTLRDGKKIRPGMKISLAPRTADRGRFRGLLAEVTEVSSFPISAEGAAKVIGMSGVAQSLTDDGHQIQALVRLSREPNGGYAWDSSGGPQFEVSSGTVALATANIKERPPVAYVFPALKEWGGF